MLIMNNIIDITMDNIVISLFEPLLQPPRHQGIRDNAVRARHFLGERPHLIAHFFQAFPRIMLILTLNKDLEIDREGMI